MKHSLSKNKKEDLIDKISSFFASGHKEIVSAYIFGSFLLEKAFSDIDIAILLKKNVAQPLQFELMLERKLEKIVRFPADVRILNHAPIAFAKNVFVTGYIVLDLDPNFRADFQGRILKQYYDFHLFHKRYLQEVANAPI